MPKYVTGQSGKTSFRSYTMCEIQVRTDRGFYYDTETIHGVVYVNVKGAISARGINIHVLGIESCMYCNLAAECDDKSRLIKSSNLFLKSAQTSLFKFKGPMPKGSYAFPFRIEAPTIVNNSFQDSVRQGEIRWEAHVKYFVEAFMAEDDTVFGRQEVLIYPVTDSEVPPSAVKCITATMAIPILKKDTGMVVVASVDKVAYTTSDTIKLKIQVQPPTKRGITIKDLDVELLRDVTVTMDRCLDECENQSCRKCVIREEFDISPHQGAVPVWRSRVCQKERIDLKKENRINVFIPLIEAGSSLPSTTCTKHTISNYVIIVKMSLEKAAPCVLAIHGLQIYNVCNSEFLSWQQPSWTAGATWMSGCNSVNVDKATLEAIGLL